MIKFKNMFVILNIFKDCLFLLFFSSQVFSVGHPVAHAQNRNRVTTRVVPRFEKLRFRAVRFGNLSVRLGILRFEPTTVFPEKNAKMCSMFDKKKSTKILSCQKFSPVKNLVLSYWPFGPVWS